MCTASWLFRSGATLARLSTSYRKREPDLRAGLFQLNPAIIVASMKLIKAIIRPNKLEEVKDALTKLSIAGMTVTEVRGHGRQKGHKAVYRGTEYSVTLLPKIMIELVIQDEMVDDTIKTIIETARTGEIGDGRVFVLPIEQGYNIRTGERDV